MRLPLTGSARPWVNRNDSRCAAAERPLLFVGVLLHLGAHAHNGRLDAVHQVFKWQATIEALILVAEHKGPTMLARIGVMRALNRNIPRVFDPSHKNKHWGRRKLTRGQ
jgi:hypothetical protein